MPIAFCSVYHKIQNRNALFTYKKGFCMTGIENRLKELRKALDLKQRQVADKLGVKVGLVGRWEVGLQPVPSTRIYQLCNEYNVRREWLEKGEGEMFEPDKAPKSQSEILQDAAYTLLKAVNSDVRDAVVKAVERISSEP